MFRTLFVILFCASICITSCKDEQKNIVKTEAVIFEKEGELKIYKEKTDSIIAQFDIEIADSDYETETGLMYRESMKKDCGMLFIFPDVAMHSFYMKNTEIPLDIIFIDENMRIASFQENAEPHNEIGLSSQVPVKYVLELNAGLAQELLLEVKDSISFTKQ
ncbi:DUF192 domain-containing protein [Cellulophaga baltica]|uniref:DUF192 domain-containing protein n=1 Tax=Cellulophaga TaxID=104264 RepID=UPI001C07223B|nr:MULTISPECIES: DUF192 domain-containing protein [Cellulophaga]MBU2996969.1 DUF192 domain-containing protein [Cellulophaga baltica]MDO6768367.1 DUF192 domain-containing protein [Cellulophaga sp. 1_MG-2023]